LFEHARTTPGDAVLIEGSGGVAVFALQFARMAGARAIVTTTTPAKRARLLELGASEVIVVTPGKDWASEVREATGGGADWTISTAGGDALDGCIAATRPGGGIVLVGVRDSSTRAKPNLGFQMRGVSMHPTRVGNRDHFEAMNRALTANASVRPVIDRVFDFDEAKAAFEYFAAARHVGKVVIRH
jgi:NADPH:quinone reductase-like Zn-dependent oxidoreductase